MRANGHRVMGFAACCGTLSATAYGHPMEDAGFVGLTWNLEAWILIPLVASAILYGAGWRRLSRTPGGGISGWRAGAFWCGMLALAIALISPLDALGGQLFSAHMIQHEVLMLIAAPLLVLGKPLAIFAWALPRRATSRMAAVFRQPSWRHFWAWLTLPSIAWGAHALAVWVWHAPALFEASLRSELIHTAQHASFLGSALLFWWALLRRRERVDPVFYLFTTLLHTGVLGMLLTFAPTAWYPSYQTTAPQWGLTPLEDQQLGGLIMWVPAGAILLAASLTLFGQWLKSLAARTAPHTRGDLPS